MERTAQLSADGKHRIQLTRTWGATESYGLWVMLNPSTADATADDPTIRRCIGFTQRASGQRLIVMNLFTYRATKPADLWAVPERELVHSQATHDALLEHLSRKAAITVVAWGGQTHPAVSRRAAQVMRLLTEPYCLGTTKERHPRHPLYVPYDTRWWPYTMNA